VRACVCAAGGGATIIEVGVESRVQLVAYVRSVRAVVRRTDSCGLALRYSIDTLAICINRCDTRSSSVVVAVLELIDPA
jgi:hypothetical protein